MASNEMSFAMIDELQAKLAELERLEAILKERHTTISNLKAFEAALHKSYDSEGNGKQPPSPPLPSNTSLTLPLILRRNRSKQILPRHHAHVTPATFTPFLTEKSLPILQKGEFGAKPILVAFPEGEETGKIFIPVPKGEALKIMMALGDKGVGGGEA